MLSERIAKLERETEARLAIIRGVTNEGGYQRFVATTDQMLGALAAFREVQMTLAQEAENQAQDCQKEQSDGTVQPTENA